MTLTPAKVVVVIAAVVLATAAHTRSVAVKAVRQRQPEVRPTQPPGPPNRQEVISIPDFEAPPPTLDQLWDRSDAIARVDIERSHLRAIGAPGRKVVITDHHARVLEIFKGDDSLKQGNPVLISQYGGTLEVDGREVTTSTGGMHRASLGEELIVFLKKWHGVGAFSIAYGPSGMFQLSAEAVTLPEFVRPYKEFGGAAQLSRTNLIEILRAKATQRAQK
jgi:hypothetical protein